ncbi:MAG: gamma-glutamyltransferase [Planctomycetota bacterium]|nr:gamma-glutamyltransferase [Planctomycetota bacterium]
MRIEKLGKAPFRHNLPTDHVAATERDASSRNSSSIDCVALGGMLVLVLAVVANDVRAADRPLERPETVTAKHGMVVSVSSPATEVGVAILKRGGNSVDAAVGVALALAVTYPQAGNIGGGGFMMVHPSDGRPPMCVEYRETAPASAHRDTFSLKDNRLGHKVVGVPGTLRGLELAHKTYGKLTWAELAVPAEKLARDGFALDHAVADSLNESLKSEATRPFKAFHLAFGRTDQRDWKAGDVLKQPDLAKTLALIAKHGADAFYHGPIAGQIVAEMRTGRGLITADDLRNYRAKLRQPIRGTFHGFDIYGPPPPSSGGICLVQMLNVLEQFPLKKHDRYSAQTLHLMVESMRRAYLDRARHLGDADFVKIPPHLITKDYAKKLAASIDAERATSSEELATDIPLAEEPPSTTHFSVMDSSGMAVSNTYTLEQSFGSRVVVRGAGFLLNNEMGDFNWKAGHTDRRGRIGTPANLIAPGKRMLSSQTPTIVARDGKPVLVTGSPGGRTIINTVLCMVVNVTLFDMTLEEAMAAPRLHHQWLPDEVRFESTGDAIYADVVAKLRKLGHKVNPKSAQQGDAHSILRDSSTGELHGVADTRRSGKAAGF